MLDVIATAFTVTVGMSFFGFGALAALLAGPARLVVVATMLLMIAASSTQGDHSDFDF